MDTDGQSPLEIEHIEYYLDGQIAVTGAFLRGEKHYAWRYYQPNGTLRAEGKYASGKKSGKWNYFRRNGQLMISGHYKNGVREREWNYYRSSEAMYKQRIYDTGKLISTRVFNHDGTQNEIVDGVLIATCSWDKDGTLFRTIHETGEVIVARSVRVE